MRNNFHHHAVETVFSTSKKVSCNGVKSSTEAFEGHPLVYLDMGKNDSIICPYCSRVFTVKKKSGQVVVGIKNQIKEFN